MNALPAPAEAAAPIRVLSLEAGAAVEREDALAVEAPLQIRVQDGPDLVTMRTPGHDLELTAGLLLSEGLVRRREDFLHLAPCEALDDIVRVELSQLEQARTQAIERAGVVSSACGVCGKTRLDHALLTSLPPLPPTPRVDSRRLLALPRRLREAQASFQRTGGLHAAALFDATGKLLAVREDVGRHNALDKLLGWALLEDRLPLHEHLVLLSGRASYELLQKSIVAGVAVVCAISAPSSYAVQLAREFGVTLVGFLREGRFNVYAGAERVRLPGE